MPGLICDPTPPRTAGTGIGFFTADLPDREARLSAQQAALLALGRDILQGGDPAAAVARLTEAAARVLRVDRASVWRLTPDGVAIRCADLYEAATGRHSEGLALADRDYPVYFQALAECDVIPAGDARTDPRTREFAPVYLNVLGIGAMLDVPLRPAGRLEGVFCCEHLGAPRVWEADEQVFAMAVGGLVSLVHERAERDRAEGTLALQTAVLEAVATGAPLGESLSRLAAGVERLAAGLICSVLLLDGDRLRDAAGPSLPAAFRAAVDGVAIGPAVGSCGTAAFRREPVVVADIATDPLWAGYRDLALAHGLRACWSTPVLGRDGRVLATFAAYHRTPRAPRPEEQALVATATHLAAVAVERRRAEDALREREELLWNVITHIPGGVFWKDRNSVFLGCNDLFARNHGLAGPAAVVGRTDLGLGTCPAEAAVFRAGDRRVMESGAAVLNAEETLTRPDGSRVALLTSKVPLRDAAGAVVGVLGVYQDVTEARRLEEQCRQAQKMEAVGRLAGGVAHDFNNLLTVINGYSELLLAPLPKDDPGRPLLEQVHKAGVRAAELTRQLLAYGRKQILRPQVLDLGALVADLGAMLQRLIGEDVELTLDPAPARVVADPGQLGQVVMNLTVNARDAMPTGGRLAVGTRAVTLGPGVAHDGADVRAGRYVLLTVSDTGCGMTPEVRQHIFEPFFTTKGVGEGTGLGLATVYGIVKQSGGHIAVESEPGRGTTFRIYLPAAPAGEDEGGPKSGERPCPRGSEVVLVVEDEPRLRELARDILRRSGYAVVTAGGEDQAVAEVRAAGGRVDLLLTDVVMPGASGRQVAERVRAEAPGARVLYMSGHTDAAVLRHGLEQGAVHFLQKPFTPAALARKVREVLDGDH
jgi:PAS domain S-box-containing protein